MTRNEVNKKIRLLLDIPGIDVAKAINYSKQAVCNYERSGGLIRLQAKIEWYLDKRIYECDDRDLREVCEDLRSKRSRD